MHKKVFALILVDQITKLFFTPLEITNHLKFLTGLSSRDFFVGIIHFHYVKNYGLAFALNFGEFANVVLISAALIFFIQYYYQNRNRFETMHKIFFLLVFAGAISNLADRLYFGFVRDFLDVGLGFTFNLADLFLIAGLVGLLATLRLRPYEGWR